MADPPDRRPHPAGGPARPPPAGLRHGRGDAAPALPRERAPGGGRLPPGPLRRPGRLEHGPAAGGLPADPRGAAGPGHGRHGAPPAPEEPGDPGRRRPALRPHPRPGGLPGGGGDRPGRPAHQRPGQRLPGDRPAAGGAGLAAQEPGAGPAAGARRGGPPDVAVHLARPRRRPGGRPGRRARRRRDGPPGPRSVEEAIADLLLRLAGRGGAPGGLPGRAPGLGGGARRGLRLPAGGGAGAVRLAVAPPARPGGPGRPGAARRLALRAGAGRPSSPSSGTPAGRSGPGRRCRGGCRPSSSPPWPRAWAGAAWPYALAWGAGAGPRWSSVVRSVWFGGHSQERRKAEPGLAFHDLGRLAAGQGAPRRLGAATDHRPRGGDAAERAAGPGQGVLAAGVGPGDAGRGDLLGLPTKRLGRVLWCTEEGPSRRGHGPPVRPQARAR